MVESSIPEIYRSVANTGVAWDSSQVKYEEGSIDGSFEVAAFQTGPNRMVALFKDVTDRVRAEEALRQRELRLQIVNDIARGIVAHETPDSIIERALMSIFQAYPKYRVVYASISPTGEWLAKRSLQPAGIGTLSGATFDLSQFEALWSQLRQRQFISLDLSPEMLDRHPLVQQFASTHAVGSVLCIPITLDGILIGSLGFDAPKSVAWNEHEVKLLLEVANYLEIVFRDQRQDDLRAAAELALRESDDRFRMALQNSDIIMFRQDANLRYTWNHNSKEPSLNDYIVGRTDHQILPTELADRLTGIKREVMAARRGRQFETELVFRKETTYWNCRLEPLFDANDEVVGVSGVSVNITERRTMEMELRRSESRFRTLADNLPAIVWVADANGDCSYFSHATVELSGLAREELTGKQWLQVIHPDDRDEFISLYRSAIAARFPFETTLRVRDAGGDYRHVLMRGVPQFSAEELTGYVGTCFDITERLESENRLRESEARLEEAQRVAHVGSFEFNAATGSVFWSDELFRIFGLDPGTFVPRLESVQQFIHHNDRADVIRQRLEALDRHEEYSLEFRIVRPDGEIRWVRSSSRPSYNAEGGLVKVIGTVIDITSQHHAEAELHQREARFHTFMDNSPAVAFMKDREGKYLYFNAAFATTFNVALADWIGHDDTEFWPPEIAEAFQKVDRQVIESGQPMQLIEQVAHEDGIHQWFSYKFPICDANGKTEALAGIAIDLTEQYRAQAEQAASEQRHRSLVDLLPDGLYIQCDRIVQYASPSLAAMLGYSSPDDLVGKHVLALFHQDSHELVEQRLAQLAAGTEKLPAIEEQLLRADGTSLECEVRAVRTTWNGRPGVQVVVSDITERKKAEIDRQHLEDQLRLSQKLETIGTMAAGIAHDFNNLLVPIIGYSELVASEELHGKFSAEYLQEVLKAAYRAKGLVAQILAFSRQQTGDRKPIQIDSVIREVIGMLRQTTSQSVHFDHSTSGNIPEVMADSTQMVQVLMNVCVNATQAMPQGGTITTRTTPPESASLACPNCKRKLHGKMAHVEIADTGCGMDAATLKRIFDPFFTTKGVGQGTGLGLAVTHGIITQHSGHICAESVLGEGTTFHLFLPVAEAMKSRFHPEIPAPVVGGTESILIIDDEPAVAHSHAATLKSLGYKVTVATEARAALDLFGKNPSAIDLVLLDQRMPDLTGDQLAVQMLRLRPDLPIVICSGYSEALNLRSAQDLGIRDVIMKPVVTSELNRALRAALEGRQPTVVA